MHAFSFWGEICDYSFLPIVLKFQLIQRGANQGFRYIQNARNGVDPSMVPQGLMGPMMPLPVDVSGMPVAPMDAPRPQPIPISALASALASATPDNQRVVCFLFNYYFQCSGCFHSSSTLSIL